MEELEKDPKDASTPAKDENSNKQEQKPQKSHKKRNIILALGATFLLLLAVPLLIAGYFGFVPILSSVMGANKAKDLGVTYTQQDYTNYLAKTKTDLQNFTNAPDNPNNPGKKIVFANPTSAQNLNVTQEELTAAVNESEWVWMPIDNAQIKISDGAVEISGNLQLDNITNFISFIGGVGYSQNEVDTAASWAKRFINDAPIYIKATGSVDNNQLQLDVQQAQIGRYTVPADIAQTVLATGTQNAISRTPGLDAQTAELSNGALIFSGTHPTTIYVKTQ